MALIYDIAQTDKDLLGIQTLQQQNVASVLSDEELTREGFVTARHDLLLLREMNFPFPHIIAKDGNTVIGYTLVMGKEFSLRLPVLIPMFERIAGLTYPDQPLTDISWFVMGQVCIGKNYRGQGVFKGLYSEMRRRMHAHFKYVITQIAKRNPRSIRAHEKVGFRTIHEYYDKQAAEDWVIVLWDWK